MSVEHDELPVCRCARARTPHEHGHIGMYRYHRCRCTPCRGANTAYTRQATRYRKRKEMVDADLVRARIAKFRTAGLTIAEIAGMCGLKPNVLEFAVYGRKGRLPRTVQASTFRALSAVTYRDVAGVEKAGTRKVDGAIARRQVQSLYSLGWASTVIAGRIGFSDSAIKSLLAGHNVTEALRAAIDALFTELQGTTAPTGTPADRARATVARNRALANGWTMDTATDYEYGRYCRSL